MIETRQVYHKRELEKAFYFAQAIRAGNLLFISGCVSWDAQGKVIGPGDMKAQVRAVYRDLKETLAAHGATFRNVIKENVFTTDMEKLEANNDERIRHYTDDEAPPPASTWIGCTALAAPDLLLEVECIALLD